MASSTKYLIDTYLDLLKLLECPVCYEYGPSSDSPSKLCQEGHFICGVCARKVSSCPLCKSNYSNVRVRILDQIIEALIYPCSKIGCGTMVPLKDLHSHEGECPCEEEDHSQFDKNLILSHNIFKHIEDYYAPFYTGPQQNIHGERQKRANRANNRRNRFTKIDKGIQCNLICKIHQCAQPICIAEEENAIDTVDSKVFLSVSSLGLKYEKCFDESESLYLNVLFDQ